MLTDFTEAGTTEISELSSSELTICLPLDSRSLRFRSLATILARVELVPIPLPSFRIFLCAGSMTKLAMLSIAFIGELSVNRADGLVLRSLRCVWLHWMASPEVWAGKI